MSSPAEQLLVLSLRILKSVAAKTDPTLKGSRLVFLNSARMKLLEKEYMARPTTPAISARLALVAYLNQLSQLKARQSL